MSISKKSKINLFILVINILFICSVFADSYYTVKKGDTLYSISKKYQLTVPELRTANNLSENDVIKIGQKLIIPSADISNAAALSSTKEVPSNSTTKQNTKTYVVKAGDTLYGIARNSEIKLHELLAMNNMDASTTLKVGQKILVPDNTKELPKKNEETKTPVTQKPASTKDKDVVVSNGVVWPLSNPKVKNIKGKVSGVQLIGEDNEVVKSVAAGTVMYTGVYRGFGEIIFVQSKTGLIYAYSGLGTVKAKKGEYILSGDEIGKTSKSGDSSIKFMVFQNGKPIDPAKAPRG